MSDTGELLAICREIKGVSLRDVAKATGLSNPFISQVENGHSELSFKNAVILCRYYGITLDRLAATIESKPPRAGEEGK